MLCLTTNHVLLGHTPGDAWLQLSEASLVGLKGGLGTVLVCTLP